MSSVKVITCAVVALLLMTAGPAFAPPFLLAPPESAWELNKRVREDPRPLEVGSILRRQPTIDGRIGSSEWQGAMMYEVFGDPDLDPMGGSMMDDGMMDMMMELLGVIQVGIYGDFLYMNNNWVMGVDPQPFLGANAWRFGTSTGPGADNSGDGNWFEVFVQDGDGGPDIAMARWAPTEADLATTDDWKPAEFFDISVAANFNGQNWQWELSLGGASSNSSGSIAPSQQEPEPGPLPYCWTWEWQQIDPRPGDGFWMPVYDGSVHNNYPEPATLTLLTLGGLGLLARRRKRR